MEQAAKVANSAVNVTNPCLRGKILQRKFGRA
jgi:hypothetical protein